MISLSLAACCRLLAIDPKTLRQWLAQAQMAFHTDPANAKIKCLEVEQVQTLAHLHGRVLQLPAAASVVTATTFQAQSQLLPAALPDPDLRVRLAQMEAQMATLQAQLTDLTLQLLREREQRTEQRLLALEGELTSGEHPSVSFSGGASAVSCQPAMPALVCHPTERRNRLIPLIEYGARGQYVLISPVRWICSMPSIRLFCHSNWQARQARVPSSSGSFKSSKKRRIHLGPNCSVTNVTNSSSWP